jgi:hypothetical protein
MANIVLGGIAICDFSGAALFNDSEDFMKDLVDDESNISGAGILALSSSFLT